jgi:hypothetical protein
MVGYLSKQQNLLFRIKVGGACHAGGDKAYYNWLFIILGSTVFGVVARLSDGNDQAYDHRRFIA